MALAHQQENKEAVAAAQVDKPLCIDMCLDMCLDMCKDMWLDVCLHVWMDVLGMCNGQQSRLPQLKPT